MIHTGALAAWFKGQIYNPWYPALTAFCPPSTKVQLEQIPPDFFNERRRAEQIRLVGRRLMGRSWASMIALQVIGSQFLGALPGDGSFAIEGTDTIIVLTGKLPIKDHHLLWVGLQVSPLFS